MATDEARELREFARTGSPEAFERLARRYAGLVFSVCLRRLGSREDAEDASQAVFLALADRARKVRPGHLASWLHGTAMRVASVAARGRARRARHEEEAAQMEPAAVHPAEVGWDEVREVLDAEVGRLPAKQREAVARHYLIGQSHAELARDLRVPEGTAASRVSAGLDSLRRRLAGRGVALGAAGLASLLAGQAQAAVPAKLLASLPSLAGGTASAAAGAGVTAAALAKGAFKMMFWEKVRITVASVLAAGMLAGLGTPAVLQAVSAEGPAVSSTKRVIKGRVVAADGKKVTISLGSSDGVRKGFKFACQAKGWSGTVTSVTERRAVLVATGAVAVGDEVRTGLTTVITEVPPAGAAAAVLADPNLPKPGALAGAPVSLAVELGKRVQDYGSRAETREGKLIMLGGNMVFIPGGAKKFAYQAETPVIRIKNTGKEPLLLPLGLGHFQNAVTFYLKDGTGKVRTVAAPAAGKPGAGQLSVLRPGEVFELGIASGRFYARVDRGYASKKHEAVEKKRTEAVKARYKKMGLAYRGKGEQVKLPAGTYVMWVELDLGSGLDLPGGHKLAGGKVRSNAILIKLGLDEKLIGVYQGRRWVKPGTPGTPGKGSKGGKGGKEVF